MVDLLIMSSWFLLCIICVYMSLVKLNFYLDKARMMCNELELSHAVGRRKIDTLTKDFDNLKRSAIK
jgi:hypothetical protein